MLDRPVFAGGIHRLEDQEERPSVFSVEFLLPLGERLHVILQAVLRFLFIDGEIGRVAGAEILQPELLPALNPVAFRVIAEFHAPAPLNASMTVAQDGHAGLGDRLRMKHEARLHEFVLRVDQ
jgi:hypothetical protein